MLKPFRFIVLGKPRALVRVEIRKVSIDVINFGIES